MKFFFLLDGLFCRRLVSKMKHYLSRHVFVVGFDGGGQVFHFIFFFQKLIISSSNDDDHHHHGEKKNRKTLCFKIVAPNMNYE